MLLAQHPEMNFSLRDASDLTPFGAALAARDSGIAALIVRRAPKTAEEPNSKGMTALHVAIDSSDTEAVSFLLRLSECWSGAIVNTWKNERKCASCVCECVCVCVCVCV